MKTVGVIAEFNPFHNGHRYLITEAKRLAAADFCVVVMSGNFVQRGAPAIMDKYTRAEIALKNGADLVLEVPIYYAAGSAEYFARGAICLLDRLGVIDNVCFGSECGDASLLRKAALMFADESAAYREALRENLKKGLSFPTARGQALDLLGRSPADINAADRSPFNSLGEIINQPNNILGIEYLRALDFFHSAMTPLTVKRQGAGYHDKQMTASAFNSAAAIRKALNKPVSRADLSAWLKPCVPENTLDTLLDLVRPANGSAASAATEPFREKPPKPLNAAVTTPFSVDDFSSLLHYKLLLEVGSGFKRYLDVTADLSDKISKNLPRFSSYSGFIRTLNSKDLTYTRISRCLLHILLDIYDADVTFFREHNYIFYARLLGFREKAGPLLSQLKKQTAIPLLAKLASANRLLSPTGQKMLKKDVQTAHIYNSIFAKKYQTPAKNEFSTPIVKL